MEKPTLEQYEQAKKNIEAYADWISRSRSKQTELIDALSEERDREKALLDAYEKCRETIVAYDIYAQVKR